MADIGISEFTFGYAFLFEQTNKNWGQLKSFPVFPNLRQEKRLGYDVKIPLTKGTAYYYQFKLSEYMQRSNSKFIRDGPYKGPYYRIKLHKLNSNMQHRLLWDLAKEEHYVYYVAPECSENRIFSDAFLNGKVSEISRLIPLENCSNYNTQDDEQHYITYEEGNSTFYQHSGISERKESIMGKTLHSHFEESRKDWKEIDVKYAQKIHDNARKILKKYRIDVAFSYYPENSKMTETDKVNSLLSLLAHKLWLSLGIAMVIIGEEKIEGDAQNE